MLFYVCTKKVHILYNEKRNVNKMGLLSNLFNNKEERKIEQNNTQEERSFFTGALNFNSVTSYNSSSSLRLSAVYSATNIISNAVASLSINVFLTDSNGFKNINYQHSATRLLNVQPSKNLSKFNFFKLIVSNIILKGNAYVLIIRDKKGNATELKFVQNERVVVNYNQQTDTIKYIISGYSKEFASTDVLHFWQHSNDLINGISIIQYAVNTLKLASDAEKHASNFYKSGAASNGIIKSPTTIDQKQKEQVSSTWYQAFGSDDSMGIAVFPNGWEYQDISVNPVDAQLLESRKYSVIDICRFMNISPVKLYDLTNSSYSSLEQTQLSFLEDTINPYLKNIEQELNRKLFNPSEFFNTVEFNRSEMLSTDKVTQAAYYKDMLVNGIMTINEVRKELNLNDIEGMDELFIQLNMSTVANIVTGNVTETQKVIQQQTKK